MAIIVVLGAIAFPSIESFYAEYKVTASGDAVRAAWAQARAQAMNDGRPYRFAVVPNKGNWRVAPDSSDFWGGNGGGGDSNGVVLEDVLPRGVRFSTMDAVRTGGVDQAGDAALPAGTASPEMFMPVATFYPDGTARGTSDDDADIVFHYSGARPLQVKLRGLTSTSTVQRLNMNGSIP